MSKLSDMIKKFISDALASEFAEQRRQLHEETASVLHDITYRLNVLKETAAGSSRVHASDLNWATPMIDGYVFTNNSPTAGSVAWTDVNIIYKGTTYTLTNGNTANKYLYWTLASTPTTMKTSATKPTLSADDILIGINEGGTFTLTMAPGKLTPGSALMDGSVGSGELGSGAVTSGKIANGAINGSGLFASGVVDSTALGSGAVIAGKIANGAINGSSQFASGVVNSTALGSGAVTAGKIATGGIDNSNAFASGVVNSTALGSGAVVSGKIANGAINGSALFAANVVDNNAIANGSVKESNMNVSTHFLF